MQFHGLAVLATCSVILGYSVVAAELPSGSSRNPSHSGVFAGWRAARPIEASRTAADPEPGEPLPTAVPRDLATSDESPANSLLILAQSPDEDFEVATPPGPNWSYPSRRATTSVPVPGFDGRVDTSRMGRSDSLALNSMGRSSTASRPRPGAAAASYQYQYSPPPSQTPAYEPPPSLPSFHATPFSRTSPSYAPDPAPCAPCQQLPFDDPCAKAYEGYRYTWDSIYFFALLDAFRLDHESTRAGGRFGFNWGLPVIDDDSGLGFQIGLAGSILEEGPQWFATSGLFYRGDMRENSAWNAGAVFDWLHDNEIGVGIGQVRGMTSITLDRNNEVGIWGALSVIDDDDKRGHQTDSVNQANIFYRYLFDSGSDVSVWLGWRSDPNSAAVGASWYAPINDYWAGLFGGYYAFEGDTWNVYSGVVRHWGNRARQDYIGQDRHLPYLPVADNTNMTLFHKQ